MRLGKKRENALRSPFIFLGILRTVRKLKGVEICCDIRRKKQKNYLADDEKRKKWFGQKIGFNIIELI